MIYEVTLEYEGEEVVFEFDTPQEVVEFVYDEVPEQLGLDVDVEIMTRENFLHMMEYSVPLGAMYTTGYRIKVRYEEE